MLDTKHAVKTPKKMPADPSLARILEGPKKRRSTLVQHDTGKPYKLEGADRARIGRLFEEITGRVQEMSAMLSRLHGTSPHWSKVTIGPNPRATDGPGILVVVCNEDTGECGCYDHEAGTCGPCPDVNL